MLALLLALATAAFESDPRMLEGLMAKIGRSQADLIRAGHFLSYIRGLQPSLPDCGPLPADCGALSSLLRQSGSDRALFCAAEQIARSCPAEHFEGLAKDKGQTLCAVCVVAAQVIENYAVAHGEAYERVVDGWLCANLQESQQTACKAFVHFVGPELVRGLERNIGPDQICLGLGVCTRKECRIRTGATRLAEEREPLSFHPWAWLAHLFVDRFGDQHLPVFDQDNDSFSDVATFRGYDWRGADCDEFDPQAYPGRKAGPAALRDHDCNGIFGVDYRGQSFEQQFCAQSLHLGVAVVGDSAGAHFSIPEAYMNVSLMGKGTFKDLLPRLANEFDVPQESGYTGYSSRPLTHSIYKYMRRHNLCVNNDYQNIGVNGGSSGNSATNMAGLARKPGVDHPMLLFFELIGNDVCGSGLSTITKQQFKENVLRLWRALDKKLPRGSHLFVFGLVDGRVLYDNLFDQLHPLGVKYPVVYDFLNCLRISPCFGFLNSDPAARDYTANLAAVLNTGYRELLAEGYVFENFDVAYYDFPGDEIMRQEVELGGDPKLLIEPCDGFHPSGLFHSRLADWAWNRITKDHPDWIGPPNPHNEDIKRIFKLQDFI